MVKCVTPLGRMFKIGKRLCKILSFFVVDKGMIKWVTPNGVTHYNDTLTFSLSMMKTDKTTQKKY